MAFSNWLKFGDKNYKYWDTINPAEPKAKQIANSYAKKLRNEGYLVRIVERKLKGKTVYVIYRREAEGKKVWGLRMESKPYRSYHR